MIANESIITATPKTHVNLSKYDFSNLVDLNVHIVGWQLLAGITGYFIFFEVTPDNR